MAVGGMPRARIAGAGPGRMSRRLSEGQDGESQAEGEAWAKAVDCEPGWHMQLPSVTSAQFTYTFDSNF